MSFLLFAFSLLFMYKIDKTRQTDHPKKDFGHIHKNTHNCFIQPYTKNTSNIYSENQYQHMGEAYHLLTNKPQKTNIHITLNTHIHIIFITPSHTHTHTHINIHPAPIDAKASTHRHTHHIRTPNHKHIHTHTNQSKSTQ